MLLNIIEINESYNYRTLCVLSLSFLQVNPTLVTGKDTECDINLAPNKGLEAKAEIEK